MVSARWMCEFPNLLGLVLNKSICFEDDVVISTKMACGLTVPNRWIHFSFESTITAAVYHGIGCDFIALLGSAKHCDSSNKIMPLRTSYRSLSSFCAYSSKTTFVFFFFFVEFTQKYNLYQSQSLGWAKNRKISSWSKGRCGSKFRGSFLNDTPVNWPVANILSISCVLLYSFVVKCLFFASLYFLEFLSV